MGELRHEVGDSVLEVIKGDITKQDTDVIVNAANSRLSAGGGVSGAIHGAAGPELEKECLKLGGCPTGDARITKGYKLKAKYVVHTVGPVYSGGDSDSINLRSCYYSSMKLAGENGAGSIAFPAISAGIFGYPLKDAAKIAIKTIIEYFRERRDIKLARIVVFSDDDYKVFAEVFNRITR